MNIYFCLVPLVACLATFGPSFSHAMALASDASSDVATQLIKLSQSNNDFGQRLALAIVKEAEKAPQPQNVFLSPFSVSTALTMLLAGSATNTYDNLFSLLGYSTNGLAKGNDLFQSYRELMERMNNASSNGGNILNVANAMAVQKDFTLLEDFLNIIQNTFSSQVMAKDFKNKAQEAVNDINAWVSEKTQKKIPTLVDSLPSSTRLVLLNAIYFKGAWDKPFKKDQTTEELFSLAGSSAPEHKVQMMKSVQNLRYGHFDDGDLLELPYTHRAFSMYIFLPHQVTEKFSQLDSVFSNDQWQTRLDQMERAKVTLSLPRFTIQASYQLKDVLGSMGVDNVFSGKVDLSKIDGKGELAVSQVIHKTFVEVNEEGSEAAAVTGIVLTKTSLVITRKEVNFNVNRPFVFLIRDNRRQLNLFTGFVSKP